MDFSLSSFLGHLEPTAELIKNDDQKVISNDASYFEKFNEYFFNFTNYKHLYAID